MNVKICGITSYEDAALALELGADRIGFVMSSSPRRMEAHTVKAIVSRLKGEGKLEGRSAVGVFANEHPSEMARIMSVSMLDEAQIEGDESPEECACLPFPWYKALRIESAAEAERILDPGWSCRRILVDAGARPYPGGGRTVGVWATLAARDIMRRRGKEFILAGGIGPRSVASVVHSLAPDGIDLCSSVEESTGRKSRAKLELLFSELRRAIAETGRAIA